MIFQIIKRFWGILPIGIFALLMVGTIINPRLYALFNSNPYFSELFAYIHFPAVCALYLWGWLHLPLPHGEWKFAQAIPVAIITQWIVVLLMMIVIQIIRWKNEIKRNSRTEIADKEKPKSK